MYLQTTTPAPSLAIPFPRAERRRLILSVFRDEEYAADDRLNRFAVLVWTQALRAGARAE